jgi:hypothetical protein
MTCGSLAARAFAVCLMVLVARPFTAPFRTCDLDGLGRIHVVQAPLRDGDPVNTRRVQTSAAASPDTRGPYSMPLDSADLLTPQTDTVVCSIAAGRIVLRV